MKASGNSVSEQALPVLWVVWVSVESKQLTAIHLSLLPPHPGDCRGPDSQQSTPPESHTLSMKNRLEHMITHDTPTSLGQGEGGHNARFALFDNKISEKPMDSFPSRLRPLGYPEATCHRAAVEGLKPCGCHSAWVLRC